MTDPATAIPTKPKATASQVWGARLADDRVAGFGLLTAAGAGLTWANWPHSSYPTFWTTSRGLLHLSLQGWVDQGALLAFFAVVGLEIRREVVAGELRTVRRAAIPVAAALVGMAVPALLYLAVVAGGPGTSAWGIPTATDVAFALGALALVGRVPGRARIFLLTLAVADDLVAIALLVVVYSHGVRPLWLAGGLAATAALAALWWSRAKVAPLRIAVAALAWWSMVRAGVEASVIGAALGTWGPRRRPAHGPPSRRVRTWLTRLQPAVNLAVLPLFALSNVGVVLTGDVFAGAAAERIFVAVVVARVLGKPLGILAGTAVARRVTGQPHQPRIGTRVLVGSGAVAGIGFTVPLLIIGAALPPGPEATAATVGLLVGSLLSVGGGALALRLDLHRPWLVAVGLDVLIAGLDVALGRQVVLIVLLGAGPVCAAVVSRRLRPTIAVGVLSVVLAGALSGPDGIWGRPEAAAWAGLVVVAAVASAAAVAARRGTSTAA